MTIALYPGKFDPIHNGHLDIANRASLIFDNLILAVYDTPSAKRLFSTEERVELAQEATSHLGNIEVVSYRGLTVDCAREVGAHIVVRGLRNLADFEFEYQVGMANRQLAPDVELCCLITSVNYAFLSATILKEVASLGGDYSQWAPPNVVQALQSQYLADPESTNPTTNRRISPTRGKLAHRG